jgi:hypothetical protein
MTTVKKVKNPKRNKNFLANIFASIIKWQDLYKKKLFENCAKYGLSPDLDLDPEEPEPEQTFPKSEPELIVWVLQH